MFSYLQTAQKMKTCLLWNCCISKSYIQRPQVTSCDVLKGGWTICATCRLIFLRTFEVGPDASVVSRCPPHQLVQEVWRRHLWPGPVGGLYLLLTGAQSDTSQATAESMNREIKENIPETVKKELEYGLCRRRQWGSECQCKNIIIMEKWGAEWWKVKASSEVNVT